MNAASPDVPPLVSIVIPCYNGEAHVGEAIDSALAQSYPRVEVVVVDDGSTDRSWEVIRSYGTRVRPIHQKHQGLATARNVGIARAAGDCFLFLDADDRLSEDTVQALVEAADGAVDTIAACRWRYLVYRSGTWQTRPSRVPFPQTRRDPLLELLHGTWIPSCALLWPRSLLESIGGYDPALTADEDGDLMYRSLLAGATMVVARRGESYYRRHGSASVPLSGEVISEQQFRSRMQVFAKLEDALLRSGKWERYRKPLGVAYQSLAQRVGATRPELARLARERSDFLADRAAGFAATLTGRVRGWLAGTRRKDRTALGPPPLSSVDAAGELALSGSFPVGAGPAPSLARRTITAAQWRLASAVVQGGLQFGVTIVLARLLPPEDFGLVALAFVVVGFATMVADLGLGPAVVQQNPLTARHLRVAFTVSVLFGLVTGAVLWSSAPLFALVLKSEEIVPMIRWESLLFVFAGLGTTARAMLERTLNFRRLFVVDLASYGLGYAVVSVALASQGFGVWSLVFGALMQSLLAGVLLLVRTHPLTPLLARREMRDLVGFGFGATLNRVVSYLSYNGDNFIVGRSLGPASLGLYARAYHLSGLPLSYVSHVAWSVLFPVYSEIRNDPARLTRGYLQAIQFISLVGAPIMAGMVVAAPHLIVGLYGPQWSGAVVPLQVLCGFAVFRAVFHAAGAVTHAVGAVYSEFRRQIVYAVLVILAAVVGSRFGIVGVATGVGVAILFMYGAMADLIIRITECKWRDFFAAQLPGLLLAAIVSTSALAARVLLERQLTSSLAIAAGIAAASAGVLPIGVYLLPASIRPVELFRKLDSVVERLPGVVRPPIRRMLRIPSGAAWAA